MTEEQKEQVDSQDRPYDELDGSSVVESVLGPALPKLKVFHQKLMNEGEPRGLIGPRDIHIIWERHILNSAAIVPFIRKVVAHQSQDHRSIADVGSGGGFPGIVAAACLPDCSFTLIEPMERRVAWLEECVNDMQLDNVTIIRARSEEVINQVRKHRLPAFAAVTCRAVAPMTKLAGWTLPLIASRGQLVALKGRSAAAEIEKAKPQIKRFHGVNPRVCLASVGEGLEPTHVVLIDKQ